MVDISAGLFPRLIKNTHGVSILLELLMQGHVLLAQVLPHGVRRKGRSELAYLVRLNRVRERVGQRAFIRIFKLLACITSVDLNVADLDVPGGSFYFDFALDKKKMETRQSVTFLSIM